MIAFRFNIGSNVGHGHFVRCNAIAKTLSSQGIATLAIIDDKSALPKEHDFSIVKTIPSTDDVTNTTKICLGYKVSCLLVDHYHCDTEYQRYLRANNITWGQYDYRCQGDYLGAFIININPEAQIDWYKDCQLGRNTKLYLGLDYAVIKNLTKPNVSKGNEGNILLCLGAGDDHKLLAQISQQLVKNSLVKQVHIVCPSTASSVPILSTRQESKEIIHLDKQHINNVASQCQIALITAGTLSFEACYLGLPFMVGYIAENQKKLAENWQTTVGIKNIGDLNHLNIEQLNQEINALLSDADKLKDKAQQLSDIVDGKAPERIARILSACH